MPIVSLAQAVLAAGAGGRLLFIDTCALLEIVRFAERKRAALASEVSAASRTLVAQTGSPQRLVVLTAEIVRTEWSENERGVLQQVEKHVERAHEDAVRVVTCGSSLGQTILPSPALPALGVPIALHAVAESILTGALEITATPAVQNGAFTRELKGQGPARRGSKKCLKDCLIAETLLEFARATHGSGRGPIVFLTYNHHDFTSGGTKPHVDLAADFARLDIELLTKWSWAAHSLGL